MRLAWLESARRHVSKKNDPVPRIQRDSRWLVQLVFTAIEELPRPVTMQVMEEFRSAFHEDQEDAHQGTAAITPEATG